MCALTTELRRETRDKESEVSVEIMEALYAHSEWGRENAGRGSPERRYGVVKTLTRYSSGKPLVLGSEYRSVGSEPETSTRPLRRLMASGWYMRRMLVLAIGVMWRWTGFVGS